MIAHARRLWGPWWPLPGAVPLAYTAAMIAIGDLRGEHVVITLAAIALAYGSARTRSFFLGVLPLALVGIGYDLVRYARAAALRPERVLGCGLRDFELSLFQAAPGVTFSDFFAAHHAIGFDLFFAVPYAAYLYVTAALGAYFFFKDRRRMAHLLWAFMIANYLTFVIWLVFPAAPPWYLHAHGCAIDLAAPPSPAALSRVDAWLGIGYFGAFYSRAASVFGAMPSMHCAYPMIGLLTTWRGSGWKTRAIHVAYTLWMFSAAIYLDHHWVVDGLAGWLVAAFAVVVAGRLVSRRDEAPQYGAEVVTA